MAIFSQGGTDERRRGEAGLSIVGSGMTITGDVETEGVIKIEGTVKGSVRATQQILLAPGGLVEGDLESAIRTLKAERDGEIEVAGPDVAQSLTALGLIDE